MVEFAKRWAKIFLVLAGITATALTILLAGDWWVWAVSGLFAATTLVACVPFLLIYAKRIRDYPELTAEITDLRTKVEQLEADVGTLQRQAIRRYDDGVDEGKMQMIGQLQSAWGDPPTLIALSEHVGDLLLVGEYGEDQEPILIGTRYEVQFEATGSPKGVVQVVAVVSERRLVHMACVERAVEDFWARLEDQVVADPTPPAGLRLSPVTYPPPRALVAAAGRQGGGE